MQPDPRQARHLESCALRASLDPQSEIAPSALLSGAIYLERSQICDAARAHEAELYDSTLSGRACAIDAVLIGCEISGDAVVRGRWRNLRASSGLWIGGLDGHDRRGRRSFSAPRDGNSIDQAEREHRQRETRTPPRDVAVIFAEERARQARIQLRISAELAAMRDEARAPGISR
jgi:hypothetical protein